MNTKRFTDENNKTKELREVIVTRGLFDVSPFDKEGRATHKADGTKIKYGKPGFRHTGDSRYIDLSTGVELYPTAKVAKTVSHKAGIRW